MSGGIAHQKRMAIIKVLLLCGSGHAREDGNSAHGTGVAGVREHARSHMDGLKYRVVSFGWFYFPAKG
ncbi:hypothetical protein PPUJ20005_27780 [Pseudomonas putida]|uniref:hypothetical protein n=1 Tax=Pseudomonas putida TaxID=303 RepID=UPI00235B993D|nr:hypothetical protein [Pseudomonas putida]GLO08809.1 hypothetical protein PPUJ20005_27780 [Pseudomonas putida]HDS0985891.1 hypothetical protein [Pseudomonas putida]